MSRSSTSTRPSPTRRTRRCKGGLSIEATMSQGGRDMTKDDILSAIAVVYDQIFNQGQADLLPGLVSGPYIQHNPLFPSGLDGIMGYIKQAGRVPCEVKRMAIDGDLAFVHVRYPGRHDPSAPAGGNSRNHSRTAPAQPRSPRAGR